MASVKPIKINDVSFSFYISKVEKSPVFLSIGNSHVLVDS